MLRRSLALSALTSCVVAAPAGAATYSVPGTTLSVAPLAGEANQVLLQVVDGDWRVSRDNAAAAPVVAGSWCSQVTAGAVVRCDISGTVNFSLGDGNDKVTKITPGHGGTLNGDAGDDTLVALDQTAANLNGGTGNDYLEADGPMADVVNGGDGDDTLKGGDGADLISGGAGTDTFLVMGGTWAVSLDDAANDGVSPAVANVRSDVENITGGIYGDTFTGSAAPNVLRGGGGNDKLDGKAGADALFGDSGDDTISARDGVADTIDCGDGTDTVTADREDLLTGCEIVDVPPKPEPTATATPTATPTVTATPTATATPTVTAAATATPEPTAVAAAATPTVAPPAVTPTATPAPPALDSVITATFRYAKAYTLFDEILIRNARAGSTITFKCSGRGCPKSLKPRTITKDAAKLRLAKPLGKAKLKVGTRFEVRVTRAGSTVGARYTVRANRTPTRRDF